MAGKRITVVLSQGQSKNPAKRRLEEEIAASLIMDPTIDFSIVPHVYDLTADHPGMLFLKSATGDLLVLTWLYARATRWLLDRAGVKGIEGKSLLAAEDERDEPEVAGEQAEISGIGAADVPNRRLYCLDLRDHADPKVYLDEIKRIVTESAVATVPLGLEPLVEPSTNGTSNGSSDPLGLVPLPFAAPTNGVDSSAFASVGNGNGNGAIDAGGPVKRRWYPIIDYDRCTNCMECIDFCLFGVYGVDEQERILVEEQDNCKKGCPACSRVCPENAILFAEHKTPAIAGALVEAAGSLKIDLSKLFGAPNALEQAAAERDTELVRDGREAVGLSVGVPKRQEHKAAQPRDELDDLMDNLDDLDL